MLGEKSALPQGTRVLVTGANGYIASHICDQLLERGFQVRGTVRDVTKTAWLQELFDERHGKSKFEMPEVSDLLAPGAFSKALEGVSGIVHVVSVVKFSTNPSEVITPSIEFAMALAHAALEFPSVKRFVFTSSSSAISQAKPNVVFKISTDMWNDEDIDAAWAPQPESMSDVERQWIVYSASKAEAEKALWKFVEEKKPSFVVNSILPNMNIGEILSSKQSTFTGNLIPSLFNGDTKSVGSVPPQWMVNVKDNARLHVAALLFPEIRNERILAYAYPFSFSAILDILRRKFPDKAFPPNPENEAQDLMQLDNSRGEQLLKALGRKGWTSLEDSVKENVESLAN